MAIEAELSTNEASRYRKLSPLWRAIIILFAIVGLAMAINQLFLIGPLMQTTYLYWLALVFLSPAFILFPATARSPRNSVAWYDIALFLVTLGFSAYLVISAWKIMYDGWVFVAPLAATVISVIYCFIVLEASRRAGGWVFMLFAAFFGAYPLFAGYMPGILEGGSNPLGLVARFHTLGSASIFGVPMQVVGDLVIGFMVFGVAMVATGGGQLFQNLALAVLGRQQGGPAKVAVFSSALFGMLSGSPVSNVISVGSVTIPTMRRLGYAPHYAAAVEACASTGGAFMPPVMGAAAFVMASFIGVPYVEVAIAAFLPAVLYYWALFWQVDGYARVHGIKGVSKSEIPPLWPSLMQGWPLLLALAVLIFFIYTRKEAQSPFYATALLLAVTMIRKKTRFNLQRFISFGESVGRTMVELVAILAGCGFILGGLSMTGVGSSLARELVNLAGNNPILMLVFGAAASYVLGLGLTATPCYILLAITLAPGLVAMGYNIMAVHLFVLYWGVTSDITPPVALAAYAASGIAGAKPLKTGMTAMRLGMVIFLVPFFFVFAPALILRGPPLETVHVFTTAAIGIILLGSGFEGYLIGYGRLSKILRPLIFVSGFLIALPLWQTEVVGVLLAAVTLGMGRIRRAPREAMAG